METKLILVKAITLLYREHQIPDITTNSSELVSNILEILKMPENFVQSEFGKDATVALRDTARWMASNAVNYTYDKNEMLQRLRIDSGKDDGLYSAFLSGIEPDLDIDTLKRVCLSYRELLRSHLLQVEGTAVLKRLYTVASFHAHTVDWSRFFADAIEELEQFRMGEAADAAHPSLVSRVDFSNKDSITTAFTRAQAEQTTEGMLRSGLQGLNDMLGGRGFRRGEFVVVSALPFCYKSGLSLDIFKSVALYNKPVMRDPNKKPLLYRLSLENPIEMDIISLYKTMAESEFQTKIDPANIDITAAGCYVQEKLQENGWHVIMEHRDPTDFTYRDLFDSIEKLESEGYEIHMINIDYLAMMSKRGCAQGPAGVEIRDLFRRVRNFTSKKGITVITPHQMSTNVMDLKRQGYECIPREVAGKGYYDGCRTLWQEVDVEIYLDLVKVNGESYLEMYRGKHRGRFTPEEHLYCVYKFEEYGGIPMDVNGFSQVRKSIGGKTVSEGGNKAWWDAGNSNIHGGNTFRRAA